MKNYNYICKFWITFCDSFQISTINKTMLNINYFCIKVVCKKGKKKETGLSVLQSRGWRGKVNDCVCENVSF